MASATPIYDNRLDFEKNKALGPLGDYANSKTYKNSRPPSYKFLGFPVYSTFGVSACPATMNSRYIRSVFSKGYDIVTCKTRRSVEVAANQFPQLLLLNLKGDLTTYRAVTPIPTIKRRIFDDSEFNISNSFGNNSESPAVWTKDLAGFARTVGRGQLLIASVFGTIQPGFGAQEYHEDFAKTAELAAEVGIKVVELNLSCPNVASEGIVCYSEPVVVDICRRTRARLGTGVKILAKIGYYTPAQQGLLKSIIKNSAKYLDGISAINTIPALIVDRQGKQAFPGNGREKAGVSGTSIKWAGLEMTRRLGAIRKELDLDFSILGIGGVMNSRDYSDYIDAGADAVQSATGAMWNPGLAAEIKASLAK